MQECPYYIRQLEGEREMRLTKRLFLSHIKSPWGMIRMWIIRDYSKAFPVQVYFWDTPAQFYDNPPEYAPTDRVRSSNAVWQELHSC